MTKARRRSASPARLWWYIQHRLGRIFRREMNKVAVDAMMRGSGAYRIGPEVPDLIEHISSEQFRDL